MQKRGQSRLSAPCQRIALFSSCEGPHGPRGDGSRACGLVAGPDLRDMCASAPPAGGTCQTGIRKRAAENPEGRRILHKCAVALPAVCTGPSELCLVQYRPTGPGGECGSI